MRKPPRLFCSGPKISQAPFVLLLVLLGGCGLFGPDCVNDTRNVTLEATSTDGVRYFVTLDEARNHASQRVVERRMTWLVAGVIGNDVVTGIRLRQGAGGPIMANLPLVTSPNALAQGDVFDPTFLTVSFDQFFEAVTSQPLFGELATQQSPGGRSGIVIPIKFNNPWNHAYCS